MIRNQRDFMDDELQRIREKKIREMTEHLHGGERPVVQPVNAANFRQLLGSAPFLVIDFWAEWCGPCRMVAPVIEELSSELAGTVTFAKCNTDENPGIAGGFGITAIPTIILFRDGTAVDMVVGAYPKEALKARIKKAFHLP
ncbi:MAG TPA: thioredoxin [Methanoregulaceae archaeon]|nr:thioredoxin [Methanoregulaceae archaeon]